MAKKKEEKLIMGAPIVLPLEIASKEELAALKTKLEEHEKTLENFRTSFGNIDLKIKNLIERNRLR